MASAATPATRVIPFWGGESPFSNFHPHEFEWRGHRYATSEHAFMAAKATEFGDAETLTKIQVAPTPFAAKKLGRLVRGYNDAVWCAKRFGYMVEILEAKFTDQRDVLVSTGDALLVEASPRDHTWGVGVGADRAMDPSMWRGANLLGAALMTVRAKFAGTDEAFAQAIDQKKRADVYLAGQAQRMAERAAKRAKKRVSEAVAADVAE